MTVKFYLVDQLSRILKSIFATVMIHGNLSSNANQKSRKFHPTNFSENSHQRLRFLKSKLFFNLLKTMIQNLGITTMTSKQTSVMYRRNFASSFEIFSTPKKRLSYLRKEQPTMQLNRNQAPNHLTCAPTIRRQP